MLDPCSAPARSLNASTTSGSNCLPALAVDLGRRRSSHDMALRYGRLLVIASSASATAKIRAPSGISVAAQLVRIAAPVPALVVRAHDRTGLAVEERDAAEHLLAEHRVRLHQRRSASVSGPASAGSGRGSPILPMSWQQEAVLAGPVGERLRSIASSELERVALDALRVLAACPCPSTPSARRERVNRRRGSASSRSCALGALELEQVPQVARVEHELLVLGAASPRRACGVTHGRPARQALDDRRAARSGLNGLRHAAPSAPRGCAAPRRPGRRPVRSTIGIVARASGPPSAAGRAPSPSIARHARRRGRSRPACGSQMRARGLAAASASSTSTSTSSKRRPQRAPGVPASSSTSRNAHRCCDPLPFASFDTRNPNE